LLGFGADGSGFERLCATPSAMLSARLRWPAEAMLAGFRCGGGGGGGSGFDRLCGTPSAMLSALLR
jgi:hypothetical protein